MNDHDRYFRDMRAGISVLVVIWLLGVICCGFYSCMDEAQAQQPGVLGPQGRGYYWRGGPVIPLSDGGTNGRSAAEARRYLEVAYKNGFDQIPGSWDMSGSLILPYTLAYDSAFVIRDNADTTKKLKFELEYLSSGSTAHLVPQDADGTIAMLNGPVDQEWRTSHHFRELTSHGAGVEIATNNTFTNSNTIISVATTSPRLDTLPDKAGTFAMLSDLQGFNTSSNRWTGAQHFYDGSFFLHNTTDTSKIAKVSAANISASTTRLDSLPNNSGRFVITTTPKTGDVLYSNASQAWARLGVGSAGSVLYLAGSPLLPTWKLISELAPTGGGSVNYGIIPLWSNNDGAWSYLDTGDRDAYLKGSDGSANPSWKSMLDVKDANLVIRDDSDTTKHVAHQASGITTGTTRTFTYPNVNGKYVVVIASADSTARVANMASFAFVSSPAAGRYRVTAYAVTTSLMAAPLTVSIGWTDPATTQTATGTLAAALNSYVTVTAPVQVASGNITVSTSGYVSGTYSVYLTCEAL